MKKVGLCTSIILSFILHGRLCAQSPPADTSYSQTSFGIGVLRFTGAEMRRAYGYGWDFGSTGFLWAGTHAGMLLSLGGVSGSGTPEAIGGEWQVKSSALEFWTLRFSVGGLYRPTGSSPQTTVTPFTGLGLFMLGGAEKFSASVVHDSPTLYEEVAGDAWAIRGSVGIFPIVGVSIPIADRFAIQTYAAFFWGTGSGFTDLASEATTKLLEEKLYMAARRPDFRFTGLQVYLGVSW